MRPSTDSAMVGVLVALAFAFGVIVWDRETSAPALPRAECAVTAAELRANAAHQREALERIERQVEALELLITQELSEECP